MRLVMSLTITPSLLKKLLTLWDAGGDPRNPFANVLVTPLFASSTTLRLIREELKDKRGAIVYFDSGGYYAQQGKISFDDLYCRLRDFYKDTENQWADWYVLPDHVPISSDDPSTVERKVYETITAARMFHAEMPVDIKLRSIPVIQGHTLKQVNQCIETYFDMQFSYIGFGSFGTNGSNSSINIADSRSIANLAHIVKQLNTDGVRLHTFGVSTPPVIYAFQKLGVYSFDSLAWQRSAGYGKVYLPYIRAYNVSHRSTKNSALSREEFELLKYRTGHLCPFCENFYKLKENRLYRSLHNLVAALETIDDNHPIDPKSIPEIISWKASHYFKLFEEIYLG